MGKIYASALDVIVWFGDSALDSSEGVRGEPDILDTMTKLADNAHFHELPFNDNCKSRNCPSACGDMMNSRWTWPQTLYLWMKWFDVSWFERAWSVQEIVLARKATLMLGPFAIPWYIVSRACVNLGRHKRSCCTECIYGLPGQGSTHIYRMAGRIIDLSTSREKFKRGQHLIDSLFQSNWKKSSLDLDKIYGFLGLQNGSISLQELYYRFARDLIFTQGWLVPLCLNPRQEKAGLPSWVTDWSCHPSGPILYRLARFQWSFSYAAARGLSALSRVKDRMLETNGIRFDHVVWTSSNYTLTVHFPDHLSMLDDWYEAICLEEFAEQPYPAGGTFEEAFRRTMFADRTHDDNQPTRVTAADIQDLQDSIKQTRNDLMEFGADAIVGLNEAMTSHIIAVVERRLFVTSKGYIGLCPEACEVGDEVFVLGSCPGPVVLRSVRTEDAAGARHKFMGHCFVHGIMYREATDMGLKRSRLHIE